MNFILSILGRKSNDISKSEKSSRGTSLRTIKDPTTSVQTSVLNQEIFTIPEIISSRRIKTSVLARDLLVLSFDTVLLEQNSSVVVQSLLPKYCLPYSTEDYTSWFFYIQDVFRVLYEKNVSETMITNSVLQIHALDGIKPFIKKMKEKLGFDIIIISNSNNYFITIWLQSNDLYRYIDKIFANEGKFMNGRMYIAPFHNNLTCNLCPRNLCKGNVLNSYIDWMLKTENIDYQTVVVIGGASDIYCPVLRLKLNDIACIRYNSPCLKLIKETINPNRDVPLQETVKTDIDTKNRAILAEIFEWRDGNDLWKFFEKRHSNLRKSHP